MAVVTVRSTIITNAIASPPVQNPVTQDGARQRSAAGVATVTNGDSIASIFKLVRVPSMARLQSLRLFNAAITSGAGNLGLYRTDGDGAAVVSVACYASAISIASATTTGTELLFSARTIDKLTNQVWQDAGLTADPRLFYDICLTLTAAAAATGLIALDLSYCVD
ncbi:hypothetical protein UFOVP843_23 [uncultured Caudovirales phage]|uniref:Uncharacterized protein n=1 Tax=uncultured Caudovirales phage TaxID=2100421 RepID=A0A6J5P8J5_9CAUD|nr:hypothetical protein UFOVP843_23 [uncultured Caudovirales phage]CAB4172555.1 hypothetical protein UFOVP936_40 [uncultured Caudovirales phage]